MAEAVPPGAPATGARSECERLCQELREAFLRALRNGATLGPEWQQAGDVHLFGLETRLARLRRRLARQLARNPRGPTPPEEVRRVRKFRRSIRRIEAIRELVRSELRSCETAEHRRLTMVGRTGAVVLVGSSRVYDPDGGAGAAA